MSNECTHCNDAGMITNYGVMQDKNKISRDYTYQYCCLHCPQGIQLKQEELKNIKEYFIMIDNRKVNDNHQQGIERVKQKKGDMQKGQGGKMGNAPKEESHFNRPNNAKSPRKA